jgi:hypothetical protein
MVHPICVLWSFPTSSSDDAGAGVDEVLNALGPAPAGDDRLPGREIRPADSGGFGHRQALRLT